MKSVLSILSMPVSQTGPKRMESVMKDPSPELPCMKREAEKNVCTRPASESPSILFSKQLPYTQRERACARNAGGREGAGSDTPGVQRLARKGEPVLNKPGLPINTISGVASNSNPALGRKQEVCTLNLIGASGLCTLPVHTESWTRLQ